MDIANHTPLSEVRELMRARLTELALRIGTIRICFLYRSTLEECPETMHISSFRLLCALNQAFISIDDEGGGLTVTKPVKPLVPA